MTYSPRAARILAQDDADACSRERWRRRLVLFAMCLAAFMIQLDVTIVNIALPTLQRELALGPAALEWVVSGYALSLAAFIPLAGALGDRFGHRPVITGGLILFGLGSLGCALAGSGGVLLAGRIVQGAGGAAMLALTLAILNRSFPPAERSHVIGTWAALGGVGFGAGPVAGGLLLARFGWASVFWVNLPVSVVAAAMALATVPPGQKGRNGRALDLPGVALASCGLSAVTLGLIDSTTQSWGSPATFGPLAAGALLVALFLLWQRRARQPLVPRALQRAPSFLGACGAYFASYTAMSGMLYYVTLLFQGIEGWSALRTGLSWLLMNLPFLLTARMAGRLDRRFSPAQVIAGGCLLGALGVAALACVTPSAPFAAAAFGYVAAGAGFGALVPGITHVAMRDVPPEASGAGSAVLNCARQLGTATGLALIGALGAAVASARWNASGQPAAFATEVAGARLAAIAQNLGPQARATAAGAFLSGYHAALAAAALCLIVGGVLAAQHTAGPSERASAPPERTP